MSNPYQGLRFSYSKTTQEIQGMFNLARHFLARDAPERIEEWKRQLTTFQASSNRTSLEWHIPQSEALRTKPSEGNYEGSSGKGLSVVGLLSGVWEIHRLPKSDKQARSHFLLDGKASVSLRLETTDTVPASIAAWNCDIGDKASPGCHFHIQCENPKNLPVPRYPTLLVTPMDALEFLLAELFQDKWEKHVNSHSRTGLWAEHQRQRLSALLGWQGRHIQECSGSPWTSFKSAKPPCDLFAQ